MSNPEEDGLAPILALTLDQLEQANGRIASLEAEARQRAAAQDPEERLRELRGKAAMDAITAARASGRRWRSDGRPGPLSRRWPRSSAARGSR